MKISKNRFLLGLGFFSLAISMITVPKSASAQVSLVGSFNPGLGQLCDIGFDPLSGNNYIYPCFDTNISEFTSTGALVNSIPRPGVSSNDFGLDFAPESINIDGTIVPSNTLLVINGDDSPETLRGLDKTDGTVLAMLNLPSASAVGGAYSGIRDSLFTIDFTGSDLIREIDTSNGSQLNSFPSQPAGSPTFDIFFGDLDVNQASGNLFLVSDSQNSIRELTDTGTFVRDIDLGGIGIFGMSGIALDEGTDQAWISSTNGTVYLVDLNTPSINIPPTANAGLDQVVNLGDLAFFDGSGSEDIDGFIIDYSWDFGDGNTDSGEIVTHDYPLGLGTYTASLTVTDNDGATDIDFAEVIVEDFEAPIVDIIIPTDGFTGILGTPIDFRGIANDNSEAFGGLLSYEWFFGDGNTATSSPLASHTYNGLGNFIVDFIATDESGNVGSRTISLTIEESVEPPERTPEPSTILSLLTIGGIALGASKKRQG